jgi:ABC-2 type transport system ATP-binding protein
LAESEGLTVLVSSHLLSEIQLMCDRVAIISKGEVVKVDSVENLLTLQERMVWKVSPIERAKTIMSEFTTILSSTDEELITPYLEGQTSIWNKQLVEQGIEVLEMNRKLPALEDLFLEMTGGESIE